MEPDRAQVLLTPHSAEGNVYGLPAHGFCETSRKQSVEYEPGICRRALQGVQGAGQNCDARVHRLLARGGIVVSCW